MSNFKAGAFFNESNIVEVGLRNPDAPADGDSGLYARDVNRGIELSGEGGGSFSIANVTLENLGNQALYGPFIVIDSESGLPDPYTGLVPMNLDAVNNTVALYKGKCFLTPVPPTTIVSATGSVEVIGNYQALVVTGDCTITGGSM